MKYKQHASEKMKILSNKTEYEGFKVKHKAAEDCQLNPGWNLG